MIDDMNTSEPGGNASRSLPENNPETGTRADAARPGAASLPASKPRRKKVPVDVPVVKKKLSARGSKRKGDVYERAIAARINERVFGGRNQVQRAPLSGGGFVLSHGGADLTGMVGCFPELKRVEKTNIREALLQAERNRGSTQSREPAVVITRKSNEDDGQSLCVMRLDSWLEFYRAWLILNGFVRDDIDQPPSAF